MPRLTAMIAPTAAPISSWRTISFWSDTERSVPVEPRSGPSGVRLARSPPGDVGRDPARDTRMGHNPPMATVSTWGPVPLSAAEIERATTIVKESGAVPGGVRFVWAAVAEAAKGAEHDGRRAEVLAYDRPTGTSHRLDVDLDTAEIVRHTSRDDVQPSIIYEEYGLAGDIVRADPAWQAAMRKRGITDFASVQVDPWATGNFGV